MGRRRRRYSRESKIEAVALVTDGDLSISQAARDLGISQTVLGCWKKQFEEYPEQVFPGKGNLKPQDEELARLRRELAIVRQERDILIKAIGIFSRIPK
jgi:transposase